MRIDWNTPVRELYRSEDDALQEALLHGADIRYIDLDENEIMHWKYIKREKVNGRWRYYYDQSELDALKKAVEDSEYDARRATDRYEDHKARYDKANKDDQEALKDLMKNPSHDAILNAGNSGINTSKEYERYNEARKTMNKYTEQHKAAVKKYNSMAVRSFAQRTISKGIVKVANLLSGLGKRK